MYVGHSPEYECMLRFRECAARRDRVCRTIVRNTNVCCDFESAQHGEIVYVGHSPEYEWMLRFRECEARRNRVCLELPGGRNNGRRKKEGKTGDSTGIRPFR